MKREEIIGKTVIGSLKLFNKEKILINEIEVTINGNGHVIDGQKVKGLGDQLQGKKQHNAHDQLSVRNGRQNGNFTASVNAVNVG